MHVPEVDIEEFARRRDSGSFVLDVRQPDEFDQAHVPGAVLIPMAEVPDRVDAVPSGAEVLVICRSGGRSLRIAEFLRTHDIDAVNVAGGTMAWIESGRPVSTGSDPV